MKNKPFAVITSALAIGLIAGSFLPCSAQLGYNPYTGSANWLWIARGLGYPLNRLSSARAPLYLANQLLYSGSYHLFNRKNRQPTVGQYYDQQDPSYNLNQRNRAVNGGTPPDQIAYQTRDGQYFNPNGQAPYVVPQQQSQPFVDPLDDVQPALTPVYAPPAATQSGPVHAPLAQGFIDLVNSKYDGDIQQALFDPQTRSFAKAIGLVDGDALFKAELSPDRLELIRRVLNDKSEDAVSKVHTVRLLLKN
jgi:hypothetical protein